MRPYIMIAGVCVVMARLAVVSIKVRLTFNLFGVTPSFTSQRDMNDADLLKVMIG